MMNDETNIALIKKDVKYLRDGIDEINKKLDCVGRDYVGRIEFELVKKDQEKRVGQIEKLVFGAIGLAVITTGKALLDLVITVRASQ